MPEDNVYSVRESRWNNTVTVWVGNGFGYVSSRSNSPKFSRRVNLRRHYFGLSSPASRLRNARLKAQKKADKLNHFEDGIEQIQ